MKTLNILKPDCFDDMDTVEYYLCELFKIEEIGNVGFYQLPNWTMLAKQLYELDVVENCGSIEEKSIKRRNFLTTLKGYDLFYNNMSGIISLINITSNEMEALIKLDKLKKQLRKLYVLETDRHYLKFENESELDYNLSLSQFDLSTIEISHIKIPHDADFFCTDYDMVFFNKIHSPDPNLYIVKKEIELLKENESFNSKRKIKEIPR